MSLRGDNMLTVKQAIVLKQIIFFIETKGIPPTVRKLCILLNSKSTSTVANHLELLQKKGYITKDPKSPRSIRVMKEYEI